MSTHKFTTKGLVRAAGSVLFVVVFAHDLFGQTVQWASEVYSFSSRKKIQGRSWINEKWTKEFGPEQVLGKPNKCPADGDSPCSWIAGSDEEYFGGRAERIKVGYEKPMQIQQVGIAENYNPGAVEEVILYDTKDIPHVVYHGEASPVRVKSRVMNVTFLRTDYKVKAVELVLQCGKVTGYNEIDAIGISDSKTPIKAEINLAPDIEIISGKENLGNGVNSMYAEVYPIISPDGKTLFFDRKDHPQNFPDYQSQSVDNIWYSELTPEGKWGVAKNIGRDLNNGYGSYVLSITPDGNTLLVGGHFDNSSQPAQIWMSRKVSAGWGKPVALKIDSFFTTNRFMESCLAADGKTLIVSLQRPDSYGVRDFYACFLRDDGKWTAPKNMGPDINSAGDESTPFLAADGKTLYFATDGRSGYGSLDIFLSRRLDDTWEHWSEPENLGTNFNTTGWDAYFTVPASGEYAYFVSSKGQYSYDLDIYRVKLPPSLQPLPVVLVSGKVIDAKSGKPIEATIHYEILPGGKEAGIAHSNPTTGEYKISLPSGEMYGFRAEANGYAAVNQNLDVKKVKQYEEIKKDLKLVPLEVGQTVRLNNLFFDFNKSVLKSESFAELDRLVALLSATPTMEVLIAGHTDNVGNDASNKNLSEARAKAVKNYLISKNIEAKRLKTTGFGKAKPLTSNDSEEGRSQNRRVEFTILKQ
jgi:outer membrane protein OmpA-like peptidoglycan-associated protein